MVRNFGSHVRNQWAGFLALFLVLTGGIAYAANTIGSSDIINESILSQDIKNGQVLSPDVANNQVTAADVRDDTFANGGLTGIDIANSSLGGHDIIDGSLTGADVNESTLDTVPRALLGGFGRTGPRDPSLDSCDPESATFVNCALSGEINVPAGGARALVIGYVRAGVESDSDFFWGACRLGTSTVGPVPNTTTAIIGNHHSSWEHLTVTGISPALPPGPTNFGIDCNQDSRLGAIRYNDASATAVLINPN